jgi:small subunit ribosomal protein S7
MPRRTKPLKRQTQPDPQYGSVVLTKIVNKVMLDGKKAKAEGIVYDALKIVEDRMKKEPLEVLNQALRNATPTVQVKARRVGGATYQVPIEVTPERGQIMAIRWIVGFARDRSGKSMAEKLAAEIVDAAQEEGATIKKRQDMHRMAESNKAFAHYRW